MKEDTRDPKTNFLWLVDSPLGNKVGLTEYTYIEHILGDHPGEDLRRQAFDLVPRVVQRPTLIYRDQTHPTRLKYTSQIYLPEVGHLQYLVVVVEGATNPNKVITWIPKTTGKAEKISGEAIYYNALYE